MEQPIGMPSQCIGTGKAFLTVFGESRSKVTVQGYIDSLSEAYEEIDKEKIKLRLRIALQIDFWSQVLQSMEQTKH